MIICAFHGAFLGKAFNLYFYRIIYSYRNEKTVCKANFTEEIKE